MIIRLYTKSSPLSHYNGADDELQLHTIFFEAYENYYLVKGHMVELLLKFNPYFFTPTLNHGVAAPRIYKIWLKALSIMDSSSTITNEKINLGREKRVGHNKRKETILIRAHSTLQREV
jgi:hypothetical protein